MTLSCQPVDLRPSTFFTRTIDETVLAALVSFHMMDAVPESHRHKNTHALRRLVFGSPQPNIKAISGMSHFALCLSDASSITLDSASE